MKTTYKFILASLLALGLTNCKEISNTIDDFFTFNLVKTVDTPLPAATPTGILTPPVPIPIPLDSATLAANNTSLSKVKTCKLSKLDINFSDPSYTMANFDSLYINIKADGLPEIMLATYGSAKGSFTYSLADFAPYIKGTNAQFISGFKCNKAPATDLTMSSTFTLIFTAQPLK